MEESLMINVEGNSGGNFPPRRVQFLTSCANDMSPRMKSPEPVEEDATPASASRTNEIAPVSNIRIAGRNLRIFRRVLTAHMGYIIIFFIFLTLLYLTYMMYWWASIYYEVTSAMPKTFAWEMIIKLLGSSYEDENCSNNSLSDDEPLPESRGQCSVNYTIPWLPIAGVMFSSFMVVIVLIAVIRLVRSKKTAVSVFTLLSILCTLKCVFFVFAMHLMYNTTGFNNSPYNGVDYIKLRQQMENTVEYSKGKSLNEIHPRWAISQSIFSCCGVDGYTTWDTNNFNLHGDPRYPKSCCNKADVYDCEKSFLTRFKVNQKGCLQFELEAVRTFKNSLMHLLIGNLCLMFLSAGFAALLGMFLKINDFSLIPLKVELIKVKWCGKEFPMYATSSLRTTSTSPSSVVSRWRESLV